jgi:outer membrane receptor for ferrienterochelin and colicin
VKAWPTDTRLLSAHLAQDFRLCNHPKMGRARMDGCGSTHAGVVACAILLALAWAPSAAAQATTRLTVEELQDFSLEQLLMVKITTPSKRAETRVEAPGIFSVITADEISGFGANSVFDVLERAPSVQTLGSSLFPRNLTVMRGDLRSLINNHVLILLDGRPIRESINGGVDSPFFTAFPVDMIERIEIVRGPGSVLYGTNAFVGTINVITRPEQKASKLKAGMTTWGRNPSFLNAVGAYAKGKLFLKLGLHRQDTSWDASFVTLKPDSPAVATNMHYGQRNAGVAANLDYGNLKLTAFYLNTRDDMLGVIPHPTWTGVNRFERYFVNIGHSLDVSDSLTISANGSYHGLRLALVSDDFLGEVTANWRPLQGLNLLLGSVVDSRNKFSAVSTDPLPRTYHVGQTSFYLQADYRPLEKIKLIAGAQANKPFGRDWDWVPRVGAILSTTEETGVKVFYGEAFRSAWPAELYLVNPVVVANPNLGPEKIATLDAQAFYFGKSLEAQLTFFDSRYRDSITRAPVPGQPSQVTYVNQGNLHMLGVELEAKARLGTHFLATLSATYQRNADTQQVAVYIPAFMTKAGALYHVTPNLTVGVFNSVFGKPKANLGERVNPEAKVVDLLSLNLNYRLAAPPALEFNVFVQNMLNDQYYYTEFQRGYVNTLPLSPGQVVFGSVALRL